MPNRPADRPALSRADLERELDLLKAENIRFRELLAARGGTADIEASPSRPTPPGATLFGEDDVAPHPQVYARSSAAAKIVLFRTLFCGREDVYATRWDNLRTGKSGWSPAVVGGPVNARRPDRAYLPLTDEVIESHLSGRIHVGIYPLLRDDR